MEKYNISRSGYLPKCHQMLRLPRKVTLQLHQILRLPRKMHPTLLHLFPLGIYSLLASILSWHLFSLSWHLFPLGIYSLLASILSWHLFSLGIYSLLASILSWHLFSLGIYSLLASILSWHLFSLGIYSLLASILSWHLFSLGIYSLLASILSWHLFSLGIYSLLASFLSWHLFSLGIYSLLASILSWRLFSLGIYSLFVTRKFLIQTSFDYKYTVHVENTTILNSGNNESVHSEKALHQGVGGFIEEYHTLMGRSRFCLAPRGITPWTIHLFVSMLAGCIPVPCRWSLVVVMSTGANRKVRMKT